MAITHQFVSEVEDGADESLVRPSNWNAAHIGGVSSAPATGNYTGNGADDRQITTGFKCSLVIIMTTDYVGQATIIPSLSMIHGGTSAYHVLASADISLHATDGFVVDADIRVGVRLNQDTFTYYYWALSE